MSKAQNGNNQAKNKAAHEQTLRSAAGTVRKEVSEIGEELRTAEGEAKELLQKRMALLMSHLGMVYDPTVMPEDVFAPPVVEVEADAAASTAQEEMAETPAVDTPPSWWARFKAFCGRNKTAIIASVCGVVAASAAVYAYFRTGSADAAAPAAEHAFSHHLSDGADASFMSKVGAWFVSAYDVVAKGVVAAKDWVVALFSKAAATDAVNHNADVAADLGMPSAA